MKVIAVSIYLVIKFKHCGRYLMAVNVGNMLRGFSRGKAMGMTRWGFNKDILHGGRIGEIQVKACQCS